MKQTDPAQALREWRFPAGTVQNCAHCGICLAACPTNALELGNRKIPHLVRPADCTLCRLCEKVCPGREIDFVQLQRFFMARGEDVEVTYNPYLGSIRRTLLAYDARPGAPQRSSAGGTVTALMRYALKSGLVGAVCSTAPDLTDPTRFIAKLVTDPAGLEAGRQSKYQAVPIGALLREIDDLDRVAFVGTSCQVAGVRKLQYLVPKFREKIAYLVGIFCSTGNLEYAATEFMLRKGCGFDPRHVTNVEFRHGQYPGAFFAENRDGIGKAVAKDDYKWLNILYTQPRCMACVDLANELADISFGDPFNICEGTEGRTACVIRTSRGTALLSAAAEAGEIIFEDIEPHLIVKGQRLQCYVTRHLIPKRNGRRGHTNFILPPATPYIALGALARIKVSSLFLFFRLRRVLRWIFNILPFRVFAMVSRLTKRS